MPFDFSSAKAFKNIKRVARYGAGLMLVAAALVMPLNVLEGGPLLSRSAIVGVPMLYLLAITLAVLWWLSLRVSEMTPGSERKAPNESDTQR